ncbi:unnamed protein product [Rotaria sp. Silwood2]|nr:unnamed protein product [Rotaria sp. Silwood2]
MDFIIIKESKSPLSTATSRPVRFSTRLPPSPSPTSKSLPVTEHDTVTSSLVQSSILNSHGNIPSHSQVRLTPSSPNINASLYQRQISTVKTSKGELTQNFGNNL